MALALEQLFGLSADSGHLEEALTHPSYANENPGVLDNQRLEFLGDSILGMFVAELLYQQHPGAPEGELTRMRAQLVNADALADFARAHDLARHVRLGRGADADGLRARTNVLADALEALLAASYLDAGVEAARTACRSVANHGLSQGLGDDPKSRLQMNTQAAGQPAPTYRVLVQRGPAHAREFEVAVCVSGQELCSAQGSSKRGAERAAAAKALDGRLWEREGTD